MTEAHTVVPLRRVDGQWRDAGFHGRGVLRLHDEIFEVHSDEGSMVREAYGALSGAAWRAGMFSMHSGMGSIVMEAAQGLDSAWVTITSLACPLPEFTRGLRSLGSQRAGHASAQARFFAPLLQGRRNLEGEADLDRRLALFGAAGLGERMTQVLASFAAERYPASPPDRRALEAELSDAASPLFARLAELAEAEVQFRETGDDARYTAWRVWLASVAGVFSGADRSWRAASGLLAAPTEPRRGRRWRGGAQCLAAVAFTSAFGLGVLCRTAPR